MTVALSITDWLSTHGLEIIAVALSPIIALRISARVERNREEANRKLWCLQTLMATRHSPFADDRIRALNMIDVLFQNDATVRTTRRNLLAALSKTDGVNPDGTLDKRLADEWNESQWELVSAMATVLKVPLTKEDFNAGYSPKALNEILMQQALMGEFNRTMIMFARKDLGLKWNPNALFKMPDGVGITGSYIEPPPVKVPTLPIVEPQS